MRGALRGGGLSLCAAASAGLAAVTLAASATAAPANHLNASTSATLTTGSISEFPLATPDQDPLEIAAGPGGDLWFTQQSTSQLGISTVTGSLSSQAGLSAPGAGIASDGGYLWVTQPTAGAIARVAPGGAVTEFPLSPGREPIGITAGPDGNVWFTADHHSGAIGRITPSGAITYFSLGQWANAWPLAITTGPDGNLWFTDSNAIGRITPSGAITEFTTGLLPDTGPISITAGPDGNLWFTDHSAIGRITPSGVITEFTAGLVPGSDPTGITAGPDGNLWFTDSADPGAIGRITPSGTITEVATPSPDSEPVGITAGPDGRIWFTEAGDPGRVGALTVPGGSAPPAPAATPPTASTTAATSVGQTTATLQGIADPEGSATTYEFDWGTSTAYGNQTPTAGASVGSDNAAHALSAPLTGLAPGTVYHFRLVATNCGGCQSGTSYGQDMTFQTAAAGSGAPTPVPAAPAATGPVLGVTAVAQVTSGTVLIRLPHARTAESAADEKTIPIGSLVDASRGVLRLTTALPGKRRQQSATVWGGSFVLSQPRHSGMVTFQLAGSPSCTAKRGAERAGHLLGLGKHPQPQAGLWAHDNHGQYSTRGYDSVATVRGTWWETVNTCRGTLTYVKRGVVAVRDLHRHRTVLVRAGHSYLARP